MKERERASRSWRPPRSRQSLPLWAAIMVAIVACCGMQFGLAIDDSKLSDTNEDPLVDAEGSRRRRLVIHRTLHRRLLADENEEEPPLGGEHVTESSAGHSEQLSEEQRELKQRRKRGGNRRNRPKNQQKKNNGGNNNNKKATTVAKRKRVVLQKAPGYRGNLSPAGTVSITHTSGSSTFAFNARNLDPRCDDDNKDDKKDDKSPSKKSGGSAADGSKPECLCGYCVDSCNGLGPMCNPRDQCMFVGHGYTRPHTLFLKLKPGFRGNINSIRVDFKGGCPYTATQRNGVFEITKPGVCDDGKEGLGTEVNIEYVGQSMSIHTSCSDVLQAGVALPEGGPFIIEGYCVTEDMNTCNHIDMPDRVCVPDVTRRPTPRPTPKPTALPTPNPTSNPTGAPTQRPTSEPTSNPTGNPTTTPTSSPTRSPTAKPVPVASPGGDRVPLTDPDVNREFAPVNFDPTSPLTAYTSAGCGPRGDGEAFADRTACSHGSIMVEEAVATAPNLVARIDGCEYMSYQVFECLPPPSTRALLENDHYSVTAMKFRQSPSLAFNPASTLAGYVSDDCGPRGKAAVADLTQCEFGHEKVWFVPWQDGTVVAEVDGCRYFSFEVYQCVAIPATNLLPAVAQTRASTTSMSCAVIVRNGNCNRPGQNGFGVGKYDDVTITGSIATKHSWNSNQLNGKVMLVHDYAGKRIGCGTIKPVSGTTRTKSLAVQPKIRTSAITEEPDFMAVSRSPEPVDCLCGRCTDCSESINPFCIEADSCQFAANEDARPESLYLKMEYPDKYLRQINVYFDGANSNEDDSDGECSETVSIDERGLFRIALPEYCWYDDDEEQEGGVSIDYIGDSEPDLFIDTSCSVPLYAGMRIDPFVVEGYCLDEDETNCTHLDQESSRVCSV